jgi:hypothetical protein
VYVALGQVALKIEPAESRHADIQNEAARTVWQLCAE